MEKWPFIVDLPINSMVIFHSYDSLPRGYMCFCCIAMKILMGIEWGNTIDPSHLLVHQGSDKPNVEKKGDSEIMEHKELECQSDSQFWDSKHRRQLVFFFPWPR